MVVVTNKKQKYLIGRCNRTVISWKTIQNYEFRILVCKYFGWKYLRRSGGRPLAVMPLFWPPRPTCRSVPLTSAQCERLSLLMSRCRLTSYPLPSQCECVCEYLNGVVVQALIALDKNDQFTILFRDYTNRTRIPCFVVVYKWLSLIIDGICDEQKAT